MQGQHCTTADGLAPAKFIGFGQRPVGMCIERPALAREETISHPLQTTGPPAPPQVTGPSGFRVDLV
jgi:hypothetical protein